MDRECAFFCTVCEITFLVGGRSMKPEKSLKNGRNFLHEPVYMYDVIFQGGYSGFQVTGIIGGFFGV